MADDDFLSTYGQSLNEANQSAADLQRLALQNMKSGSPGRMLLGAGQDVLAPIMGVMSPVTAGLDVARQGLAYRFGEPAGNAFDVASSVVGGPEDVANALRLAGKITPVAAMAAIPRRSGSMEEAVQRAIARSEGKVPENTAVQLAKGEIAVPEQPEAANIAGVGHNMPPKMAPKPVAPETPQSMYDIPAGSKPEYLGAAPDRSDYSLLRLNPKRGVSERTQSALDALNENRNGVKDQMLADIQNGQTLLGDSWYNTEELRDWFIHELGPERGHAEWRDYMNLIGASSTGAKVPANIGIASYYRNKGPEWVQENADKLLSGELLPPKGSGYGHKMQRNHAANVANLYTGEWGPEADQTLNPKPRGFVQSLIGNPTNIAADLHFTRYMAMASGSPEWLENSTQVSGGLINDLRSKYGDDINKYISTKKGDDGKEIINFRPKAAVKDGVVQMQDIANEPTVFAGKPNDNEYRAFEQYMNQLGKELGMTGAQVQANLWMGAAKRTGLADESQGTFMQLLRERAANRAAKEGISQADVLKRFIREKGLLVAPLAAGAAAYGSQEQEQPTFSYGGSVEDHAENIKHALRLATGGRAHFDDGGDVRGGDNPGGLSGDTGAYAFRDVGESQGAVNAATARAQDAQQAMREWESHPTASSFSTDAPNTTRSIQEASPVSTAIPLSAGVDPADTAMAKQVLGQQKQEAFNTAQAQANAIENRLQGMEMATAPSLGATTFGANNGIVPAGSFVPLGAAPGTVAAEEVAKLPFGIDPKDLKADVSQLGQKMPSMQPTDFSKFGQLGFNAGAAGTPLSSLAAAEPQHYEPLGNQITSNQNSIVSDALMKAATFEPSKDAALRAARDAIAQDMGQATATQTPSGLGSATSADLPAAKTANEVPRIPVDSLEDPALIAAYNAKYNLAGPRNAYADMTLGQRIPNITTNNPLINTVQGANNFLTDLFTPNYKLGSDEYNKISQNAERQPETSFGGHGGGQQQLPIETVAAPVAATPAAAPVVPGTPVPFTYAKRTPYLDYGAYGAGIGNVAPISYRDPINWALVPGYRAAGGRVGENNALANAIRLLAMQNRS